MLRAFQWDLARQIERLDWLSAQLPRYADWGYQELYLHLEDAIEYPSLPGVARKGAYTHRELGRLVEAATRVGINVVPIVNLLGHTQYLIKVPELRDLNELRAPDGTPLERGQICPLHPRTAEVAQKLLRDVAPFCTAGKVHVGLDESFHLGKHPLSVAEIAQIGRAAHFAKYVGRLRELTRGQGLAMGMWADMLYFLPGAIPLLPRDISAYEWYYYGFKRRPRVELFNFAESDLGEKLRARGIGYWGCPMNGAFRFEPLPHFTDRLDNILSWWRRCRELKADGFLVTSWEPYRLAIELTTVVDAAAASLWLDGDTLSPEAMLEHGFARVFGKKQRLARRAHGGPMRKPTAARIAAKLALACDRFPFSGYPRWEISSRWDVVSRREPIEEFRKEEMHFRALLVKARRAGIAEPLRRSIELRWALAARDVGVRKVQRRANAATATAGPGDPALHEAVRGLRAALNVGLRAARAMWNRTRDPSVRSPNEEILLADLARLGAFERGDPVFGPEWQLCYRVRNVGPAIQLVGVEQQREDGSWETRQACYTIEFQTIAAQRRSGLIRAHAAPIAWNGDPQKPPRLRVALRGVGEVAIDDLIVTNGETTHRLAPARVRLAKPTPKPGWVEIDWNRNVATSRLKLNQRRAR